MGSRYSQVQQNLTIRIDKDKVGEEEKKGEKFYVGSQRHL